MSRNFSLKFKIIDLIIIIFSLVLSSCLIVGILWKNNTFSNEERIVHIYQNNVLLEEYTTSLDSLSERKTIILSKENYATLLDDFTIELDKSKGVHVTNITCYDHTCEKQGWVNIPSLSIICIPNSVVIEIVTSSNSGGDFVIGGVIYA